MTLINRFTATVSQLSALLRHHDQLTDTTSSARRNSCSDSGSPHHLPADNNGLIFSSSMGTCKEINLGRVHGQMRDWELRGRTLRGLLNVNEEVSAGPLWNIRSMWSCPSRTRGSDLNKVERMDGVRFEQKTLPFCPHGRHFECRLERYVTASRDERIRNNSPARQTD